MRKGYREFTIKRWFEESCDIRHSINNQSTWVSSIVKDLKRSRLGDLRLGTSH